MTFLLKKAHCNAEIYMFKNLISILLLKKHGYFMSNLCSSKLMSASYYDISY